MSPIGRLFFEISGDSSKLNQELQKAIATAKDAGVQITRAGQSFISKFDEALNPTKKLTEQIPRCCGCASNTTASCSAF